MVCDVCSNEYGRGKGFKGDRFLANHFCCKDCYNNFVTEKDNTPLRSSKTTSMPSIQSQKIYLGTGYYAK